MFKKFLSVTVTVLFVSLVAGYVAVSLANPNAMGILGKTGSKVIDFVSPAKMNDAHANAAEEDQATCQASNCHKDMKTEKTPWHKMHLTISLTNFTCQTCHKKVTTKPRTMAGKVNIDRSICLKCHRERFEAFLPQHGKANWVRKHKQLSKVGKVKDKCFDCHNPKRKELDFCKVCHKRHDHSTKWIFGGHGKKAREVFDFVPLNTKTSDSKKNKKNKKLNAEAEKFNCLQCHEKEKWCAWRCHQGVVLPHKIDKWEQHWDDKKKEEKKEPSWYKVHFRAGVKLGYEKCRRCHKFNKKGDPTLSKTPFNKNWEQKEFCQQCHHKAFYEKVPTLNIPWATKKGAMFYVRNYGSDKCWKCHDPDFCSYCHTKNVKPPYVNFTKKTKSSNYKPADVLYKEVNSMSLNNAPSFYNYYNNKTPVEKLYPEFDERGFFRRSVPFNRAVQK